MKKVLIFLTICLIVALGYGGYIWYTQLRGAGPALLPSPPIAPGENNTNVPLSVPNGFRIDVFADGLSGARALAFDKRGNLWVSRMKEGIVTMVDIHPGGVTTHDIFFNLNNPHGLAFDLENPNRLYIAEEDKISFGDVHHPSVENAAGRSSNTTDYDNVSMSLARSSIGFPQPLMSLPAGGRHVSRTLFWAGDNQLYISIGSTCDVCEETDSRHGTIMRVNLQEKKLEPFASGLRNSVFAATHLVTGDLWATEMGRDHLGDELPPDEVNIIQEGKNYGWPLCYGKRVHDAQFDSRQYLRDPCEDTEPSHIDLPAHVAPLGLGFIPEEGWPEEYWYDLLIAVHGSWNRSEPIGYKIIRIQLDANGQPEHVDGEGNPVIEDFISGWLTDDERALGRPVDMIIQPGGVIYISDDKAGVIYKVTYSHDTTRNNLIRISSPRPNQEVMSPFHFEGEARGTWFFEASFPVYVIDDESNEIGVGIAQAQSEWMTEEFVPFQGTVEFTRMPNTETGRILFQKDNPSGLKEHADVLSVPIRFKMNEVREKKERAEDGCVITGCSSHVCSDTEVVTDCLYREEYVCYEKGVCEKQDGGQCGWTVTEEIQACLDQFIE